MISAFGVDHDLSKAERAPIKGVRGNTLVPPRPEKYGSTPWKRRATRRGKTPPPVLARLRQSENPRIARRAENIQFDYGTRQRPGAGNYPRRTRDTTPTKLAARKVGVMQSRMLAGEKYSMPKLATKLSHFRKSAFGVEHDISKIDAGGGRYVPAVDFKHNLANYGAHVAHTSLQRQRERSKSVERDSYGKGRDINAVFHRHGIGAEGSIGRIKDAKTTPSPSHKNIEYADSIPKSRHAEMDKYINPKLAAGLKHKVVVHHDPDYHRALASAAGAHKTIGGKGHVLLGEHFNEPDKKHVGPYTTRAQAVNHEISHASVKSKNPGNHARPMEHGMGEEARADVHSGADIYHRNGLANSYRYTSTRQKLRDKGLMADHFGPKNAGHGVEPIHFPHGGHKLMDMSHVPRIAASAGIGLGAVGGAAALMHYQNKKKVKKCAFGVELGVM